VSSLSDFIASLTADFNLNLARDNSMHTRVRLREPEGDVELRGKKKRDSPQSLSPDFVIRETVRVRADYDLFLFAVVTLLLPSGFPEPPEQTERFFRSKNQVRGFTEAFE